jgi:TonB family protein
LLIAAILLLSGALFVSAQDPPRTINGGVLNGKAVSLPKPAFPDAAKQAGIEGAVRVEIVIDENGNVESAHAVKEEQPETELTAEAEEAWAALRSSAEEAALKARFSPTLLSGMSVKVKGTIVFNFLINFRSEETGTVIDGGVINGKAIELPNPSYPAAARAVRATGVVAVKVIIDETGSIINASAVSGHPLLQAAAVAAARSARFEPTYLSGQPVKVSGVITYNFVLPTKVQ